MAKNWAIVIGVNEYSYLDSLKYAKIDAEAMYEWLQQEGGFNKQGLFLFTDNSPPIPTDPPIPTTPSFGHLRTFFNIQFERQVLTNADNLWFFFSGHGNRGAGGDYLMLSDSNPRRLEKTALSVSYITERLRNWGAGNVVMFIDACRHVENQTRGGEISQQDYQGMITFYSCRDKEKSLEVKSLERGAFTHVLLQALKETKRRNKCLTVAELEGYLMSEVPKLSPNQHPLAKVEPTYKSNFILFGEAQEKDVKSLYNLALKKAFVENKQEEARELLLHANKAAKGGNLDIIEALQRLPSSPQVVEPVIPPPKPKPKPTESPVVSEVELKSEKGVNYTKLRDLLNKKKWFEADQETTKVMLKAADREEEGWLRIKDVENFPCEDLRTINQLWLHYSKGKFGFSVQKEIYESLGGTRDYNEEVWNNFGDRIGWRKEGEYLMYEDLTFNLELAPKAHLPREVDYFFRFDFWDKMIKKITEYDYFDFSSFFIIHMIKKIEGKAYLFSRAKTCNV